MNLIHTELRNIMSLERVFKLMYIHFNLRQLNALQGVTEQVGKEVDKDDLALEDHYLYKHGSGMNSWGQE